MACDCLNRIDEKLAASNTRLVRLYPVHDHRIGMTVSIATVREDTSKRGKPMTVIPTFCPFCGEGYRVTGLPAEPAVQERPSHG